MSQNDYLKFSKELAELAKSNNNLLAKGTTAEDISESLGMFIEGDDLPNDITNKIAVQYQNPNRTKSVLAMK